jgi:hypothetical protein
MSEEVTGPKVTVSFERKLDLGSYNNCTASAYLSVPLDADASPAVITEAITDAFQQVKAAVYDELGIEVTVSENGIITEVPGQIRVSTTTGGGGAPAPRQGGFDTKGLKVMNTEAMKEDIPDWLVDECGKLGITGVWVNEGKYGTFYKEAVAKGEEPKNPNPETGKPGIISKPKG